MTEPFMVFHHEISDSIYTEGQMGVLYCQHTGETRISVWFNVGQTRILTDSSSSYTAGLYYGRTYLIRTTIPPPADDQHDGLWNCESSESDYVYIGLYTGS